MRNAKGKKITYSLNKHPLFLSFILSLYCTNQTLILFCTFFGREREDREDKGRQKKTEEDKGRQKKTEEDKGRQGKTEEDKGRQKKTEEDRRRQKKTREDRRRQGKTEEDKGRQKKTELKPNVFFQLAKRKKKKIAVF